MKLYHQISHNIRLYRYKGRHRKPDLLWTYTALISALVAIVTLITMALAHPAGAAKRTYDAAALAINKSVTAAGTAAAAARRDLVVIEDHTGWSWPVKSNTWWADNRTGASVWYGTCNPNYRCIRVYEGTVRNEWAAVTYFNTGGDWYTEIYVNPQRNGYTWAKRDHIVKHELGHAFCIFSHHPSYYNLMYASVTTYNNLTSSQLSTMYNCR